MASLSLPAWYSSLAFIIDTLNGRPAQAPESPVSRPSWFLRIGFCAQALIVALHDLAAQRTVGVLRPVRDHQLLGADREALGRLAGALSTTPADAVDEDFGHIVLVIDLRRRITGRFAANHVAGRNVLSGCALDKEEGRRRVQHLLHLDARNIGLSRARTGAVRHQRVVRNSIAEAGDLDPLFKSGFDRLAVDPV